MSAMLCPPIYNSTIPQTIITANTINLVRTSSEARSVGAVVNVSCYAGRTLIDSSGRALTTAEEKKYTCINSGGQVRWDKALPTCGVPTTNTSANLTQQELIVIGVVAAICLLVLIMVIVMLCACWYKKRRDRTDYKRPGSEYSGNTGEFDRYKPYSMYSPFPGVYREGTIDRRPQYYSASLPRSTLPESFPRPSQHSAYELATRSAVIRTKPYVSYDGPRVYRASSDTYEDYLAQRNTSHYKMYSAGRDNEGFRGEWNDRMDRKNMSDFNNDALVQGRDPFLWDRHH